jgi:hypothetical protein
MGGIIGDNLFEGYALPVIGLSGSSSSGNLCKVPAGAAGISCQAPTVDSCLAWGACLGSSVAACRKPAFGSFVGSWQLCREPAFGSLSRVSWGSDG